MSMLYNKIRFEIDVNNKLLKTICEHMREANKGREPRKILLN
jgi:hypothetical protein